MECKYNGWLLLVDLERLSRCQTHKEVKEEKFFSLVNYRELFLSAFCFKTAYCGVLCCLIWFKLWVLLCILFHITKKQHCAILVCFILNQIRDGVLWKNQTWWEQIDIIFGFSMKKWLRNTYFFQEKHDGHKNLQPCVMYYAFLTLDVLVHIGTYAWYIRCIPVENLVP